MVMHNCMGLEQGVHDMYMNVAPIEGCRFFVTYYSTSSI